LFAFVPLATVLLVAQASPAPAPSPVVVPVAVPIATPGISVTPAPGGGLVLPPAPVIAPSFAPLDYPPSGDQVGTAGPFVGLTLTDAIAMALARNTDLSVSQSNRRIAGYQIVAAEGAYDLQFVITPSYSLAKTPAISSFESGPGGSPPQQITSQIGAQIQGITASGGQYSFNTSAQRVNSNLTINSYDPYYQTSLGFNFSQPLLRGRAIDATRRQLQLAKINADLSNDQALTTASNTLSSVLDAYYDLVAAWKNVAIQEDALRQARLQSESNARLVRRGASAPVDVIESDTQVDIFQNDVYSAIANVASLQNRLKQLILSDPADPVWMANLVPVTPDVSLPPEPNLNDVLVAALRARPEVGQLRESVRSSSVDLAYFKDQTKPQINLNAGITEGGFAGTAAPVTQNPLIASSVETFTAINQIIARVNSLTPPGTPPLVPINAPSLAVPGYTVGGLGTAYSSMFALRYPQYTIGASVSFPLRNRTAEAQYKVALEQRKQLEIQEVALIQRLQYEARNALQSYRSARARLLAATAARKAAEAVEASELRRFKAGASTTFLVLQREINVANQRGSELQAQTDVQKALVEIDRVTGDILAHNQVQIGTLGSVALPALPVLTAPAGTETH
jgi:HAE1 family hydrophobic/amphiphilic exporter-1